jgi:hypothetical protein
MRLTCRGRIRFRSTLIRAPYACKFAPQGRGVGRGSAITGLPTEQERQLEARLSCNAAARHAASARVNPAKIHCEFCDHVAKRYCRERIVTAQ